MTAFRNFQRVHNNKVEVALPDEFEDQEVEIIVMPKNDPSEDLSFLEEAITLGLDSGVSDKGHEVFMQELKAKYA